ncbi:MAG: carbohydrate ABC transporter permease [Lachnospiraceae bacterium]|nr:carbohydrate ABC transporter permease [Lachnospiraceae bacterium]
MKSEKKKSKIASTGKDRVFYIVCGLIMVVLTLMVLYPVIYVISASFSNADRIVAGKVWLWPVDINLDAYKLLFSYDQLWTGYANTIFYTVTGTLINLGVTLICAYPMARKNLMGRGPLMMFFSFTMLFSGGMIPNYILVKSLGMLNTRWAMLLPGAMSIYNMIVARTFIQSNIPDEMLEAAQIDGCNDFQFFFRMVLPLSKAIIAVLALWYGVSHWNSYFNAFLYLKDRELYPLQIFLKDILVQSESITVSEDDYTSVGMLSEHISVAIRYCMIVVSTVPLFCVYPFVSKHFQKGVMVGSVKG